MTHSIFKSIKLINPATNFNQKVNVVIQNETIISISKDFNLKYFNINSGLSIYNVYNRKNISHKRYNPFSSGKIISNVMMLGITPTIFFEINI